MKTIVIAASGYIGNVIAERLANEGFSVTGTTRSQESASKLQKQGVTPLIATLEDPVPIIKKLDAADAVVYCAYAYNSIDTARNEIESGKSHLSKIFSAMKNSNKHFVLISGTGVVPDSTDLVYDEDTPLPPSQSPVTIARRNLEQEVIAESKNGIKSVVLRPPCVYGRGGSFIVPRFLLDHALKARESVYVEGSENNKRSTVHVEDLADLVLLSLQKARAGSIYCTGAESGITTLSIAQSISRCAGLGGKVRAVSLEESRQIFGHWGEWWSMSNQTSGNKARSELGWNPYRLSLLDEIEKGSYSRSGYSLLA